MKKISKVFKCLILALLAALLVLIAGCTSYVSTPGTGGGNGGGGGGGEDIITDGFTVKLKYNNADFTSDVCAQVTDIVVKWTDIDVVGNAAVYTAKCNKRGVASAKLDGDFKITLENLPTGYTYDPNRYEATNFTKDVIIDLIPVVPYQQSGTSWASRVICQMPGVYRLSFASADSFAYVSVSPVGQGVYYISTLIDTVEDNINPSAKYYVGNSANLGFLDRGIGYICDYKDGGAEGNFTKNFFMELDLRSSEVGQEHFLKIGISCKSNVFPVTVDLRLSRERDYSGPPPLPVVAATENFPQGACETPAGKLKFCGEVRPDHVLFDGKYDLTNPLQAPYAYSEIEKRDDGYYYYVDGDKPNSGKKLYAKLYNVRSGKGRTETGVPLFNENLGYGGAIAISKVTFDNSLITLTSLNGKNYHRMIRTTYKAHMNDDGCYPVTDDLIEFLYAYAVSEMLFYDGLGTAENPNADTGFTGYQSDESSQWMFACCYYDTEE